LGFTAGSYSRSLFMRLLVVQFTGDYRGVIRNPDREGVETYHAQKYLIQSLADLSHRFGDVTLLCCRTAEPYWEEVSDRFRVIGAGINPYEQPDAILAIMAEQQPTHIIIHTPVPALFKWANRQRIPTLALLADSFHNQGLRRKVNNYTFQRLLNHPNVEWIANHGINACHALADIGVKPAKLIPWDWPYTRSPRDFEPKTIAGQAPWNFVYVGAIQESKGVGDIVEAVAALRRRGQACSVQIAGGGNLDFFVQKARDLGVEGQVKFLGQVPHQQVLSLMRSADAVLVPSWHEYGEGMPLTIYESFCARTPVIASDHPMFRGNVQHRVSGLMFPERHPMALANCMAELMGNPALYAQISQNTPAAWENLQLPVRWAELVSHWVDPAGAAWLQAHRLESGLYDARSGAAKVLQPL
jgi:glycosyltransferase involved in cell wall biosynthesis